MFNQRSSNQFVHLETKFEFLLQELQVFLNSLYNMSNLIMNNILCFSLFFKFNFVRHYFVFRMVEFLFLCFSSL